MKKTFIYGTTDLAQLLYLSILSCGSSTIEGFVVDDAYRENDSFMDLPVIPLSALHISFPPDAYGCYIAVGYSRMNENRKRVYTRLKKANYKILEFIHPTARVNAESCGEGNIFFAGSSADYYSSLGMCNIFCPGASLAHHSTIGDFNFFAVAACVAGHVRIGDNSFIGANATVIDALHIGDYCLVGAGACLTENLDTKQVFVPTKGAVLQGKHSFDFL